LFSVAVTAAGTPLLALADEVPATELPVADDDDDPPLLHAVAATANASPVSHIALRDDSFTIDPSRLARSRHPESETARTSVSNRLCSPAP
jgi:hypothetical protein